MHEAVHDAVEQDQVLHHDHDGVRRRSGQDRARERAHLAIGHHARVVDVVDVVEDDQVGALVLLLQPTHRLLEADRVEREAGRRHQPVATPRCRAVLAHLAVGGCRVERGEGARGEHVADVGDVLVSLVLRVRDVEAVASRLARGQRRHPELSARRLAGAARPDCEERVPRRPLDAWQLAVVDRPDRVPELLVVRRHRHQFTARVLQVLGEEVGQPRRPVLLQFLADLIDWGANAGGGSDQG